MQDDFLIDALEARDIAAIAACLGLQLIAADDKDEATIFETMLDDWDDGDRAA